MTAGPDKHDKTEAPTAKRKHDARKKGQVARSPEVVMWLQILVASFLAKVTLTLVLRAMRTTMTTVGALIAKPEVGPAMNLFGTASLQALLATAPLLGGMALVAVVGNIGQTGFILSGHKLKPSFDRLNPMKGLKRLLAKDSMVDATKQLARLSTLGFVAWGPISDIAPRVGRDRPSLVVLAGMVGVTMASMVRNVAFAGLGFAILDFTLQKRRLVRSLKMSKTEVKNEHRSSEGDPHVHAHRRARQMAMSRNRMMADVASATAVVVNPTHIAVAITYRRSTGAPRVVAKGKGEVARRIREEAERHSVPIVRDVALARALHGARKVGQEIPADLYEAVARLLAFIMTVGKRASWAGPLVMR